MNQVRKQIVSKVKRALIKIGTGVLAGTDGLDLSIVEQLVDEMVELRAGGMQIVIVTSGAIASG